MKLYILVLVSLVFVVEVFASTYGVELSDAEKFTALTNYLVKKELKVSKPKFPQKPSKPTIPKAKKLTKGKYEKIKTFKQRVEREKAKRQKMIKALEIEYAKKVKFYNDEVKRLTDEYNNKVATKQKNIKSITFSAMEQSFFKVYGKPYLASSLKYDPESEIFYAKIRSTRVVLVRMWLSLYL